MSGLDAAAVTAIYDSLLSHAKALKLFGSVTDHEPVNPPGDLLSFAIMLGPLDPLREGGLAATSVRLEFQGRIYAPRRALSEGTLDRKMMQAAVTLLADYSGDFTLLTGNVPAGLIRNVDLLGQFGQPLRGAPGWLMQDGAPFRVYEVFLPLIINDAWGQLP